MIIKLNPFSPRIPVPLPAALGAQRVNDEPNSYGKLK